MPEHTVAPLLALFHAIGDGESTRTTRMLRTDAALAVTPLKVGASRENPDTYFLEAIAHHVYAGDTALHVAAAAHDAKLVKRLLALGADVHARNRRGASALHDAVDGGPHSPRWHPRAQRAVISRLLDAGADVELGDKGGVTPLHRAVRNRCAQAVALLIERGANVRRPNGNGSRPIELARITSGRGGTGSPGARREQQRIIELLERALA